MATPAQMVDEPTSDAMDSHESTNENLFGQDRMTEALDTRFEEVYELSEDGATYVRPSWLRGVPVERVAESSTYWISSWDSLDAYLAREETEEQLKKEYGERAAIDPSNKAIQNRHKLHKDNVSKQRKIREVFGGDTRRHPNQLVAKGHLPLAGLCEQEAMYMLGCKMTDLEYLKMQGKLAMSPWDFLRWRIGRLLMKRLSIVGQSGKELIRSVIFNISSEKSDDPTFREIIRYSARLTGRDARYGQKRPSGAGSRTVPRAVSRLAGHNSRAPRRRSPARRQTEEERKQAVREMRRQRAQQRAQQGQPVYQGVNAFRAQQQKPLPQPTLNGGPCGG